MSHQQHEKQNQWLFIGVIFITNVFSIVERSQIAGVMQELQLAQTGMIDESQAAQVGKILGVDAIITGSVSVACEDRWVKENRQNKN